MLARFIHRKKNDLSLHRAIISDIVLWVILAVLIALGVYWFAIRLPERGGQAILLKFRDANQITRGSTVTMLGTDVGYVKDIWIHQNHVDVLVQTYSHTLTIPSGADFTVLFNGLAGSKSIDIEVPKTPLPQIGGHPIYTVSEPIRLKTLLDYAIDMTQALTSGAQNVTDFLGKKKPVEELQFNIHQVHRWTLGSLALSETLETNMLTLRRGFAQNAHDGLGKLRQLSQSTQVMAQNIDPERMNPSILSSMQTVRRLQNAWVPVTPASRTVAVRVNQFKSSSQQVNVWTQNATRRLQQFSLAQFLDRLESGEDQFIGILDQLEVFFRKNDKQQLQQMRQNIRAFNKQVLCLSLKLDTIQAGSVQSMASPSPSPKKPNTPVPSVPAKAPKPTPSSDAAPLFPVVDRSGKTQKHVHNWWENHPAAKRELYSQPYSATAGYIQPKEKKKNTTFYIPLLQGMQNLVSSIWDSIVVLFTS